MHFRKGTHVFQSTETFTVCWKCPRQIIDFNSFVQRLWKKNRFELLKKGKYSFAPLSVQCLGKCRYLYKKFLYFLVQCLFLLIASGSGAVNILFYTCYGIKALALEHLLEPVKVLSPGHKLSQLLVIRKNKAELPHGRRP